MDFIPDDRSFSQYPGIPALTGMGGWQTLEKIRDPKIDLLIGGMMELPVEKALGIEHLDIMHGGQRTIGFDGAKNLIHLLSMSKNCGTLESMPCDWMVENACGDRAGPGAPNRRRIRCRIDRPGRVFVHRGIKKAA